MIGRDGFSRRRVALAGLALIGAAAAGCRPGSGAAGGGKVLKVASQRGGTKALMLAAGALTGVPYKVEWSEFPADSASSKCCAAGNSLHSTL